MSAPSWRPLTEDDVEKLARALFEEDERMLPEGRTWETIDNSDRAFYRNGARVVVGKFLKLQE
jgi:hypothetical protein